MTFRGSLPCFRCLQTPCWLIQVSVTSHLMDNKLRWKASKTNVCYTIERLSSFLLWHKVFCFEVLLRSPSFSKHLQLKASASSASISSSILVRSPTILVRVRAQRDVFNSVYFVEMKTKTRKLCELYCTLYVPVLPSRMPYVLSSEMAIHFTFPVSIISHFFFQSSPAL